MAPDGLTDRNQGPAVLAITWLLRSLVIIVVGLRLYTRKAVRHTAGWDDAAIAVAACVSLVGAVSTTLQVEHGFGRHAAFLSPQDLATNARFLPMTQICNFISLFWTRTSICIFTLRLLPKTQQWPQRITWAALVLNFLSTLANCLVFSLACRPTTSNITHEESNGCATPGQLRVGFAVAGVISILIDFLNVGLPVFVIRNLQMKPRTKLGVAIVMSLGLLTAACSIGKLIAVRNIVDPTWDGVPVSIWGAFEEDCGIIFASMPAMRQLYKHWQGTLLGVTGSASSRGDRSVSARSHGKPEAPHRGNSYEGLVESQANNSKYVKASSVELDTLTPDKRSPV